MRKILPPVHLGDAVFTITQRGLPCTLDYEVVDLSTGVGYIVFLYGEEWNVWRLSSSTRLRQGGYVRVNQRTQHRLFQRLCQVAFYAGLNPTSNTEED